MFRNCLLFYHNNDVHLLSQMMYVSRDNFVNVCIPSNSWKGLATQLLVNGVMSSCMTHNGRTLGEHTKVMQELFAHSGSFSFSWNTQNIGLLNVHFGTWSLFCDVGSLSSHIILSWQILPKDIKVSVHLELHVCWEKQALC